MASRIHVTVEFRDSAAREATVLFDSATHEVRVVGTIYPNEVTFIHRIVRLAKLQGRLPRVPEADPAPYVPGNDDDPPPVTIGARLRDRVRARNGEARS